MLNEVHPGSSAGSDARSKDATLLYRLVSTTTRLRPAAGALYASRARTLGSEAAPQFQQYGAKNGDHMGGVIMGMATLYGSTTRISCVVTQGRHDLWYNMQQRCSLRYNSSRVTSRDVRTRSQRKSSCTCRPSCISSCFVRSLLESWREVKHRRGARPQRVEKEHHGTRVTPSVHVWMASARATHRRSSARRCST